MIQTYRARLIAKKELAPNTILLDFKLTEPTEINFTAGQYALINIPKEGGETLLRHFSFANTPGLNDQIELVVKLLPDGVASNYYKQMQVAEEISFKSPFGLFILHPSDRDKVFLATGTGIAPIMSMLKSQLTTLKSKVRLFWGLRRLSDVYFLDKLKELEAQNPHFKFQICLSQEKDFSLLNEEDKKYFVTGRVNAGLDQELQASRFTLYDFYVCGDRLVVESLRQYLYEKGVIKEQVFFEKF